MGYRIQVLKVGQVDVPGPEIFWMGDFDKWYTLSFNAVLIQGEGRNILLNSGPPDDVSAISAKWTGMYGPRAALLRSDDEKIVAQLKKHGLSPADITDLIVTPFQVYSTAGITLFANATVHVSKQGWIHYHTSHSHPHDDRWSSISPEVLKFLVIDHWDKVNLLEDEDEVAPGVRTWWTGTHHRASIAVEVDTPVGVVVASDAFFYYENVEENRMLGICENMYEAIACYERTRRVAKHLIPLYDPRVFDRYPGGLVSKG